MSGIYPLCKFVFKSVAYAAPFAAWRANDEIIKYFSQRWARFIKKNTADKILARRFGCCVIQYAIMERVRRGMRLDPDCKLMGGSLMRVVHLARSKALGKNNSLYFFHRRNIVFY